ncbi:MAG TPA: BMP family ABC transporter substrate-binding protein [Lachnospiraceae bacterium]|nr:BMP family ABC transporter substrate-binding protein [Lachnospiraceae bacterium]
MAATGLEAYTEARKLGLKACRRAVVNGHSPYPAVLDDILKEYDVLAEVPVGLMELPLDMVAGTRTAGRTTAFSNNFMPILKEGTEFQMKWSNLYESQMDVGIHDPIKCYEFLNRFYVLEGNKRVSVSRYCKLSGIMADVTRVLPRRSDAKRIRLYYEFLDFFKVCPLYQIEFTQEGFYSRFAEALGQNLTDPWPDELIETIKAAYATFEKLYVNRGGDKLETTTSDAFLVYLNFYPIESLIEDSSDVISSRITRLWNEILTESTDSVTLVEDPKQIRKDTGLLDVFRSAPDYSVDKPLSVAFIYDKNPENSRWIYGHELGRNHLVSYYEGLVDAVKFEDCDSDEKIQKAIDAAAADEDSLVFTTSPAMMPATLRSAIHYPKISFLNCSINLSYNAVRTYYCKMYEAKYILGALAASMAENHKIGYLADYPIYGCVANINAFAIGASLVDPKAKIYLQWSSRKGESWREWFAREGVRVISGPDLIMPKSPSREYGLYLVEDDGTVTNLAMPVMNWGTYYEQIVRRVLEGNWEAMGSSKKREAVNYWWGMQTGVVDVLCSERLPYTSKKLVEILRHGIITEQMRPFDGELHSQKETIKTVQDPLLTNEQIIEMNWLNDNVIGSIPETQDLVESAQGTVKVAGIDETEQTAKSLNADAKAEDGNSAKSE